MYSMICPYLTAGVMFEVGAAEERLADAGLKRRQYNN
jgi:hypothetical protein